MLHLVEVELWGGLHKLVVLERFCLQWNKYSVEPCFFVPPFFFFVSAEFKCTFHESSTGFYPTGPAGGAWCPTDLAPTTGKSGESPRLFFTDTMCRCPLKASRQVLIKCEMRGTCIVSHSFHELLIIGGSVKASSGLRCQSRSSQLKGVALSTSSSSSSSSTSSCSEVTWFHSALLRPGGQEEPPRVIVRIKEDFRDHSLCGTSVFTADDRITDKDEDEPTVTASFMNVFHTDYKEFRFMVS